MIFSRFLKKHAPEERVKPGSYRFSITGTEYYLKAIMKIIGGHGGKYDGTAQLRPEPDNKYDPDAIQVIIKNKVVGYIPRECTSDVRRLWPYINSIDAHLKYVDRSDIGISDTVVGHIFIIVLPEGE